MYELWLSMLYGIGSRKQNALLGYFKTAKEIYNAPVSELRNITWLTDHNIHAIISSRKPSQVEKMQKEMEKSDITYFHINHPDYPELLANITDPPVGIFVMGEMPDMTYTVGLIGSRRCSEYGLSAARLLAKPLARKGVVIISGMARGIDSMAHKGALEAGGKTVAVLGSGVDICYPSENYRLKNEIVNNGCVISEYPPGTSPHPFHFPARNRIISGLSNVVVVVEAAKKSGTLITVDQAQEQGREVMVVPGNITSKMSEGTNNLIREGAAPVTGHEDILYALGIPLTEAEGLLVPPPGTLAPDEKVVYDSLTFEPVSFDELTAVTKYPPHVIHYLSAMLEIKGYIKKLPGMRFIRNLL
jgi:DNA processing protein